MPQVQRKANPLRLTVLNRGTAIPEHHKRILSEQAAGSTPDSLRYKCRGSYGCGFKTAQINITEAYHPAPTPPFLPQETLNLLLC